MDEIKLRYFVSVARHLSFTKAAEDCHVTQSTISKQILALEEELGAQLFVRDHRMVMLTPAGARLANDAEDYMEQYRMINESIRKLHLELDAQLTIGVGPWEFAILNKPLGIFTQRYPHVEVYCTLYTHKRMVAHFRSGTFDVGLCHSMCTDAVSGLRVQRLTRSNFQVAAPQGSSFWALGKGQRAHLQDQIVITLYDNEYEPVRPYCIKNSMANKAFSYSNQYATQTAMMRAGMGIALMPGFFKPLLAPDVRMEDVLPQPLEIDFVAACNPNVHNKAALDFMEICRELWEQELEEGNKGLYLAE